MDLLSILFIALSLSADCFAVAVSCCLSRPTLPYRYIWRTAFAFGLFQFFMPILGWLAGRTIMEIIADFDHWVVFTLLVIVGGRMIWESFHSKGDSSKTTDLTKTSILLTLSVATSIDALSVGLSFAFLKINIMTASLIIGIVAFAVTMAGFLLSKKAGGLLGKRAKFVGGLILIGIGLRVLLTHLR